MSTGWKEKQKSKLAKAKEKFETEKDARMSFLKQQEELKQKELLEAVTQGGCSIICDEKCIAMLISSDCFAKLFIVKRIIRFTEAGAMYINRTCEKAITDTGKSFPCIVVYGPRQIGKSTTIDYLFGENFKKVTLDDIEDRALAEANPKLFLDSVGWPVIIDEIQKVPLLLDEIKNRIDEQRLRWLKSGKDRELMYVLTGSSRFELQQSISDSLAGRCGIVEMASFTRAEKSQSKEFEFSPELPILTQREAETTQKKTRQDIFREIFQGGMPDVCTGVSERNIYFKSYVNTYIEKDVRKLINASSELQFRNFVSIVALRTAQEVHYEEIASAVGIDVRTCKKWLSILETSGIICFLQPYMANMSNRVIKCPKLYFMDTGLCAWLCKWPNAEMLADCAMSGAFFETYVVSELVKNTYAFQKDPRDFLFYYRDIDQKEIDIVYVKENRIYPIEIKAGILPEKAAKNFDVLQKYHLEIQPGLVINNTDRIRPINEHAYYVPVSLLP